MVMRHINRRRFTKGLALATVLMPIKAVSQDELAADSAEIQTLTASQITSQILGPESPPTDHWQFKTADGTAVLRAKQGQELRLKIFNELDEPLWLHFFGVRGPSDTMTVQVPARESAGVDVAFTPPDAGTFWFGPLLMASKQREMGLQGMLIVEETEAQPFQDVPLVFDDWLIGDDGKIESDFANLNRAAGEGRLGNWFTVNGRFKPRLTFDAEKPARLRLLNVANTRTLNVMFKGAEGLVVARDGQPQMPKPLGFEALKLAPGQRADIILTDAQEQIVLALDLFEDVVETAFIDATGYGHKTLQRDLALPANPVTVVDSALASRAITFAIEGGLKGGLLKANVGKDVLDMRAMLEQGLAWAIGGSAGLGSPPLFVAKKGEVLLLTIENKTAFEQPLHLHGHVWTAQLPMAPDVEGPRQAAIWSDTLVLLPKSKATVLMVADNPGTWAIQSLLAERSDSGLIGAFVVSDMP
jgi:FtsP/CotA-like multicopper oxidase with cupredoxin domain